MQLLNINICKQQIPVIYEYSNSTNLVNLRLVFKNSGKVANKIAGLSYILAGILNEGSKSLTALEFFYQLEVKAIELEASSASESLSVELTCLKEHFSYAISMLLKLLNEPKFDNETLELVKTKTLGLICANKSDLDYQAKLLLNSLIYKNSAFEHSSYGDEQSIKKITLSDIKEFFNQNLCYENLFIVLGGNVKINELDLSSLKLSTKKAKIPLKIEVDDSCREKEVKMVSEQAYIYFAAPFFINKENRHKASVASFILGSSGFGSRLLEEIRVKNGLAYSAYAKNSFSKFQVGIFGYLQTKNENKTKAMSLVKEIFAEFCKSGASKSELESAKNFLLGSEVLNKETLFKRLNIAQNEYYMGYELGEFDKNLKRIKALSLDELNHFICSHNEICKLSFATIYG